MKISTRIYVSSEHDPWINLSLEETLFRRVEKQELILFLWRNHKTVVVGRNQNAWKECRLDELEKDGGKLARRLSGGGAVYHDLGNLNFSFIMHHQNYSLSRQLHIILEAIRALGLDVEFSGRNDLLASGRKFSGNSFCFAGDQALHHGTLLVSTDMAQLGRYLNASPAKMNAKGIASVRSRVVNLAALSPEISIETVSESIKDQFRQACGSQPVESVIDGSSYDLEALLLKNASWEWRLGKSPAFDISVNNRFSWGEIEVGLVLRRGIIQSAAVYSDALEEDLIRNVRHNLVNIPYRKESIISSVQSACLQPEYRGIIADICHWLSDSLH